MLSRRELLKATGQTCIATGLSPLMTNMIVSESKGIRSINVINFIRGVEPRGPMDLFLPIQKQMEISLEYKLPTTWLLQYDALVSGPFVKFLKANMADDHEVGIWFEMNEMHCKAAGVNWRGRPGYEWDHYPNVAFTIGYNAEERVKLADTFMAEFKLIWGKYPKSVASWNLDSLTMAHLTDKYGIDAYAVCRDQIATDGFTIWGAPFAGYYPSKANCWSPAVDRKNQIDTPVLKMLGQDPVYYYYGGGFPMPDKKRGGGPDTMEPVWSAGRSPIFIKNFLDMIAKAPTLNFGYAQLGQENNFGWSEMEVAYPLQMKALADLRDAKALNVETMGETGRRFKKAFKETPAQAQCMLVDPMGNTDTVERSIWYQSRFYRADLHLKGDKIYLRDLTIYSDNNPQPFLHEATTSHDVEQRMPSVLDGYHWSKTPGSAEPGAGGYFLLNGEKLTLKGEPRVKESGSTLLVECPVTGGRTLHVKFEEQKVSTWLTPDRNSPITLSFVWDPTKACLISIDGATARYRWQSFEYSVSTNGAAKQTADGWNVQQLSQPLVIQMTQS